MRASSLFEENTTTVAQNVLENPGQTSIRRQSQGFNIPRNSMTRISYKNVGMAAYNIPLIQKLKPGDHQIRFRFA